MFTLYEKLNRLAERLRPRLCLWVALAVVVPRLAYVAVAPNRNISGNAEGMLTIAGNLANGKGFLDAWGQPDGYFNPGYPFFLAGCRLLFGESLLPVKLCQIGFDVVTALVLCFLASKLLTHIGVLLLGVALALHPLFLHYTNNITQEPMLICMVALSVVTLYQAVESGRIFRFAVAGVVIGGAVLTKTTPLFLPFLVGLIVWTLQWKSVRQMVNIATYLAVYLLILAPWSYRNYVEFGKFSPGVGGFGTSLWWGSDPRIFTSYGKSQRQVAADAEKEMAAKGIPPRPGNDVIRREQWRWEMAMQNYREMLRQPLRLLKVLALKFSRSLYASEDRPSSHPLMIAIQAPTILLSIVGVGNLFRRGRDRFLTVLFVSYTLYFYVMVSAAMPMVRYFVPALPLLLLLALAGIPECLSTRSDNTALIPPQHNC